MKYLVHILIRGVVAAVLAIGSAAAIVLAGVIGSIGSGPFVLWWIGVIGLTIWTFIPPKPDPPSSSQDSRLGHPTKNMNDQMASAIFNRNEAEVQRLLEKGFDVNAPNEFGVMPLKMAKNCDAHEIVSLLLKHGANEGAMAQPIIAPDAAR